MKTIALVFIASFTLHAQAANPNANPLMPANPKTEEELGMVQEQAATKGKAAAKPCNTYAGILKTLRERKLISAQPAGYAKRAIPYLTQFKFPKTGTNPATFKLANEGEICVSLVGTTGSIMMKREGKWWDGCNEHPETYMSQGFAGCVRTP